MRGTFRIALLAATLIGAGPAWSETIPGSEFQVGIWQGFAMAKDATGTVHCTVALRGAFGDQVMFTLGTDNRFLLALTLPVDSFQQGSAEFGDTTFQRGDVVDVSIWTNVEDTIAVPATAADATALIVAFTDIGWAVDYLRDSQLLTVAGEFFQHSFSIVSAGQALDQAQACLARYAAPG